MVLAYASETRLRCTYVVHPPICFVVDYAMPPGMDSPVSGYADPVSSVLAHICFPENLQ